MYQSIQFHDLLNCAPRRLMHKASRQWRAMAHQMPQKTARRDAEERSRREKPKRAKTARYTLSRSQAMSCKTQSNRRRMHSSDALERCILARTLPMLQIGGRTAGNLNHYDNKRPASSRESSLSGRTTRRTSPKIARCGPMFVLFRAFFAARDDRKPDQELLKST